MKLKLDLAQSGLPMLFKEYTIIMLRHLWKDRPGGIEANSATLWDRVNKEMAVKHGPKDSGRNHLSRASVIGEANSLVDSGVWGYRKRTGKGGYQRVYHTKLTEPELWKMVKNLVLEKIDKA